VSLKKNLLYNFLLSFSQVAFPLISIPYITRVLDPAGIGKVGFIDSMTYYFIVIAEFGITSYGIREVARKRDQPLALRKIVSELVSLHLVTSAVTVAVYLVLVSLLYHKINDPHLIFISLSFLIMNAFTSEWYFWGTEQFRYITFRSLLVRVLGLISVFLLVKKPADYVYYYGIITATAVLIYGWNYSKLAAEVSIRFGNLEWRKHIPFLSVTYKISLVYSVVLMLDNVFLRLLSTSAAVAYYMFAAKVVRISGALISDTLLVFYPRTVYEAYNNKSQSLQATITKSAQLIVLTTIPMAGGILLLAEKLTRVYFGAAFMPLADNLKILALYPFLKAYSLFLNKQLLMPFDREKLVLNGLMAGAVIFVAATIPLSYFFADKGTSIAVVLSEMAVLAANLYYVKKMGAGLRLIDWKSVQLACGGVLLFVPLIFIVDAAISALTVQLIVSVLVCMLSYFLFLFFTGNELVVSMLQSGRRILRTKTLKHDTAKK
jgi:O-antigen/teichoic acid export membrane protein